MNAPSKPGVLAIISVLCGVLAGVCFCIFVVMVAESRPETDTPSFSAILQLLGALSLLLAVAGSILGVVGIRKKDTRRIFPIIGLGLNLICLIPIVFGLVAPHIPSPFP
jgi:MFS family permease